MDKTSSVRWMGMVLPTTLLLVLPISSAQMAGLPACYRVRLGQWSGAFPSGLTAEHIPPPVFKLDTLKLAAPFDRWGLKRVLPASLSVQRHSFPAGWRVVALDTIEVRWSTGFAGVRLRLNQRGDTLTGYAQSFWDVVGPREPTASVTAVKVE